MLGVHQQPLTPPTDRVHSARGLPHAPNAKRLKQPLPNALIRTTVRSDRTAVHPKRDVIVPVPPNLFHAPLSGRSIREKRLLRHRTERKIAYKIGNRRAHNVATATKEDATTNEGVTTAPLASPENIVRKEETGARIAEKIGVRIALHPMPPSIPTSRPLLRTRPSGARTSARSTRTDTLRSGSGGVTKKKNAWQERMGDAQIGERIALPQTPPCLEHRPSGARTDAQIGIQIGERIGTRTGVRTVRIGARIVATVMHGGARTAISMD